MLLEVAKRERTEMLKKVCLLTFAGVAACHSSPEEEDD